jgi:hypothetical protein
MGSECRSPGRCCLRVLRFEMVGTQNPANAGYATEHRHQM